MNRFEILAFIESFTRQKGYSPTRRELSEGLGLTSSASTYRHLSQLQEDGLITWRSRVSRGIQALPAKGLLWLIVGPSGSGKTTLVHALVATGRFHEAVSHTTRARREGEIEGTHYHFVDKAAFARLDRRGELLQRVVYDGLPYGMARSEIIRKRIQGTTLMVLTGPEVANIHRFFPEARVAYVLPPSNEELTARMSARGDGPGAIAQRLALIPDELYYVSSADVLIFPGSREEMLQSAEFLMGKA